MVLAVADASVVVKWFLEETDYEAARRLREDFFEGSLKLRVPAVLPFEVLNALRHTQAFGRSDVQRAAESLDRAGLPTAPLAGAYMIRTVEFAYAHGLTVYDASYVVLAELNDATLFTADEAIIERVAAAKRVRHIRDYARG